MSPEIKLQSHSIVAVGDLNPAIFQPAWFAGEGLITRGEAQAATVQVISAQATQFEVDWLSLQVLPERFAATTTNEAFFQHLHDLVAATFSRLVHTPIRMLGINFNCHCHLEDPKWSELSDVLAPKAPWSRLLESPQIHGLTMEGTRPTGPKDYLRIRVKPSVRVQDGLFIDLKNHYDTTDDGPGCRTMLRILSEEWSAAVSSTGVLSKLLAND
jgi:hypothetical protein